MGQIGSAPWSFKSDTGWRGMTTSSKALPSHFDLLENCYISPDGSEIRSMPGYVCVFDPVTDARLYSDTNPATGPQGFESIHQDARRPVSQALAATYLQQTDAATASDRMLIWNRPTTIHGVEQVHGRWIFFGESSDRFEPIYNAARTAFIYVTAYDDSGGFAVLTISGAPDTTTTLFNTISATSGCNRVYVEGTGSATLDGKSHTVTSILTAPDRLVLGTALAATSPVTVNAIIARVSPKWASASATDISNDQESLTIWTATQSGDVDSNPIERVYPAHVANRQRDFGDAISNIFEGLTTGSDAFLSRRRQVSLPYRIVPHLAGNRLMMVAPGYGCVFQAPAIVPLDFSETSNAAGVQWVGNDIHDKPRCVGLPKAVQYEALDKAFGARHVQDTSGIIANHGGTDAGFAFGGSSYPERTGTYKFCFAYKDEATGEIGLMSEPVSLTTDSASSASIGLYLYVYFPGYLMHECLALSVNVYRTIKDGDTFYYDRTIKMSRKRSASDFDVLGEESSKYGVIPAASSNDYSHHVWYAAIYQSDDSLKANDGYVPSSIEQMPMGAKAARTIRGWTIYGGSLGDSGPNGEMQHGTLTLEYEISGGTASTHFYNNEVTTRWTSNATSPFESMEEGFGCGSKAIPSAYMGQQLFSRTLFPYPRQIVRLNKLINTRTGDATVRFADVRYSILDTPVRTNEALSDVGFRSQDAFLLLPRGKLQISEPDNPGVVPATNTTTVANESDDDIEGIGDAGGQGVVCTRSKTYMLGFGGSPVGVNPDIASDQFGCIAPNSMVSFDGGCAWLSDRGPVAMMGGTVTWIGQPLERLFYGESSRYLRDRNGMMRHSWGHHDAERGLLYFGVFANRAVDTTQEVTVSYRGASYSWTDTENYADRDKIRSRFPCDEVLVYSYRTGVWSVWRPPTCLGIMWMARGLDADGNNRTHFLGSDKRLYAMDDAFGQFDRESNKTTIAQTGTVTTLTGLTTGIKMRASQTALFYTGGGTTAMRMLGKRTISSTTDTTVTLDSSITIPLGGCTMLVGPHESKIRTTFVNWKRAERSQVGQLGLRYSLWSRHSAGLVDEEQGMFASVTGKSSTRIDGVHTVKTGSYTTDGSYTYQPLSETPSTEHVFEKTVELGEVGGMNHQFEIELVGGAQIRIADLYTSVK